MTIPTMDYGAYGQALRSGMGNSIYENFTHDNFRKFRVALANSRLGVKPCRILSLGDSNTNGYRAADTTADYRRGYQERARSILDESREFGIARTGLVHAGIGGAFSRADQRFTLGAGWTRFDGNDQGAAGGGSIGSNAGVTAGLLSFTFDAGNTFDLYFAQFSGGNPSVDIYIDGGESPVNISLQGGNLLRKVTVQSATLGPHTVNIKAQGATGNVYLQAAEGYDRSNKGLRFSAIGFSGGNAVNFQTVGVDPWGNAEMIWTPFPPDLTIVSMSINAHQNNMSETSYKTEMLRVIRKAKTYGDVILLSTAGAGSGSQTNWGNWLEFDRAMSRSENIGLINMQKRWNTYAVANAAGLWGDVDHPSLAGYVDMGQAVVDGIRLASGSLL